MKKLESTFLNMTVVLTVITLIAAVGLAAMYDVTKAPIDAAKQAKQEAAIKEVLPEYATLDTAVVVNEQKLYRARNAEGKVVGVAIETWETGFSGPLKSMVGIDAHGNIVNYVLLEHSETPGLGSKAADWFKVKSDIRGRNIGAAPFMVGKDGGDVDAITAATISSRAFLRSVNKAVDTYRICLERAHTEHPDAFSAATTVAERRMRDRFGNAAPDADSGATRRLDGDSVATPDAASGATVQADSLAVAVPDSVQSPIRE